MIDVTGLTVTVISDFRNYDTEVNEVVHRQ